MTSSAQGKRRRLILYSLSWALKSVGTAALWNLAHTGRASPCRALVVPGVLEKGSFQLHVDLRSSGVLLDVYMDWRSSATQCLVLTLASKSQGPSLKVKCTIQTLGLPGSQHSMLIEGPRHGSDRSTLPPVRKQSSTDGLTLYLRFLTSTRTLRTLLTLDRRPPGDYLA